MLVPDNNTVEWILTSADMKSRVLTARRLESVSSDVVVPENGNLHGDVSVDTGVALDTNGWGVVSLWDLYRLPSLR